MVKFSFKKNDRYSLKEEFVSNYIPIDFLIKSGFNEKNIENIDFFEISRSYNLIRNEKFSKLKMRTKKKK
jgi:hypothetical protein